MVFSLLAASCCCCAENPLIPAVQIPAATSVVKMLWMLHRQNGQPQRRKFISRVNAYHGVTVATAPHFWRCGLPGETEQSFSQRLARNPEEMIVREGPDTIAGMFAEPVQGSGGVIPPSKDYFEAIRPILRTYDIPLIADEVITGFGRRGAMWGSELSSTSQALFPACLELASILQPGFVFDAAGAAVIRGRHDRILNATSHSISELFRIAEEFHLFVAGCSRNTFVVQAIAHHNKLRQLLEYAPLIDTGRLHLSGHEHLAVLDALDLVRKKEAAGAMRLHLRTATANPPAFTATPLDRYQASNLGRGQSAFLPDI